MKINRIFIIFLLFSSVYSFGHGGKKHREKAKAAKVTDIESVYIKINDSYKQNIRPIFAKKCLACHATNNSLPWYYSVPGVKQLMDDDMEEAKEHMDMSNDFPFAGHGSSLDDLEALKKTIDKGDMPPFQYKIINWKSGLTEGENRKIKLWINESKTLLTESNKN